MKIAFLTSQSRYERFSDPAMEPAGAEYIFIGQDYTEDEVIAKAGDAEIIIVDAMLPVTAKMIEHMPRLKLIHSEGVGFSFIDTAAAKERGVYVCNNRAVNAAQVAEHTVMLILAVIRRLMEGDACVRAGKQAETKERYIIEGLHDLVDARVGMVGFGAIGKELAARLRPFGCKLFYYDPIRATAEQEAEYGVCYLEREELLRSSDIITLHVPLNESTANFINRDTLAMMKPNAIVINCARGQVVNSADLAEAIMNGTIYGAGLDTTDPEPAPVDDPIILMPEPWKYRVVLSPHVAGTTLTVFYNSYKMIWRNVARLMAGEKPVNIVNE